MPETNCKLCGLPVPTPPISADGHRFCCSGCREVYRGFGADVLGAASARPAAGAQPDGNGREAFLRIDGMHCSSCEILIERLTARVAGVLSVRTSYATSTARIVFDPSVISESDLPKAIGATGYKARLSTDSPPEIDTRLDLLRVLAGTFLAGLVMMIYVVFFYPVNLGLVFESDFEPIWWLAYGVSPKVMFVVTTALIAFVGTPMIRGAWIGLRARALNMDNLLTVAVLAAYGYSIGQLAAGSHDLYFDVAATITTVVAIGRYFEKSAKAEATRELMALMEARAPKARIRWGGGYKLLDIADLEPGEHVVVWQGEPVPVNGTVVEGRAAIDESLMTGEPFPISRGPGDFVLGGSLVVEGYLTIDVGAAVENQMDNLARVLWTVQSGRAGAQRMADLVAQFFVPAVFSLAGIVTVGTLLAGNPLSDAVLAGLATLIVSCPCTFGLAIPLTTAAGVSTGLRRGIIVSSADAFDKLARIDIVAIDKTGTLSSGAMTVGGVAGPPEVARYAAAVERLSSHPIAKAIALLDDSLSAADPVIHPGKGALATVDGKTVAVGSRSLFAVLGWTVPDAVNAMAAGHGSESAVISYVGWDGAAHGTIATNDQSRPEWESVIDRLRARCRVVLLTGADHPSGYEDRVDQVFCGVPPEGKAAVIRGLKKHGTVVMIGDGSNDAPALAAADLGIAFGAPTALAVEAADVIIPGERLGRLFVAFDLLFTVRRRVRQNLGWALLYNAVAIPLAVTGLLNPVFAAIAMSSSSLLVVWNSARAMPVGDAAET